MRFLLIAFAILCFAVPTNSPAQSGVITGPGGASQCYVLIDSLPATYSCNHRASVACVDGSAGFVGFATSPEPLTYPLAIQLRQLPSNAPAGILTINQLPSTAGDHLNVWLNNVSGSWVLSAPFTADQQCAPANPPATTWRDERVCRMTGRLCGG